MSEYNFRKLLADAVEEFKRDHLGNMTAEEKRDYLEEDQPHDDFHEIADSSTPVYNYDLLMYAANDLYLATEEPELGPAFDGSPTPCNIIAANIYEAIEAGLWEWWNENREAMLEELEQEETEE